MTKQMPTKVELIPSKRPSGNTFWSVACHGSKMVLKETKRGWICKDYDWVVSKYPAYVCCDGNLDSVPYTREYPEYYSLADAKKLKKYVEENGIDIVRDRYAEE